MNELQIFSNPKFGEIRTVEINKKPYFVGNDIAKALEYARPYEAISTHCKGAVTYRVPTKGGEQGVKVIPEGDVYRLIVKASEQSKSIKIKEKAEHFESWIFDTILPSIRKNGMYATDELLDNPDLLIQVATRLKEEKEKTRALQIEVKEKEKQIDQMQPKANYYDLILHCKDLIATTIIAKDYGMTAQAFNKLLHNLKIQYKRDGVWVLYRNYENQGYTGTKTYNYSDSEAVQHAQPHTYWTQKGRVFLYRILKENGYLPVIEQNVAI